VVRVLFPALADFLRNSGPGLVSTIEVLLERKSSGSGLEAENTAVRIRTQDIKIHVTVCTNETEETVRFCE
jgi:hypothetical protein